ncbi:MAG: hypothetical protein V7609_1961 [Verrucomicrobiota bacterium]
MRADVEILFLPYDDRSQNTVADVLLRELKSRNWTSFRAAVAFARQTGNFEEIQSAMEGFCEDGGTIELTFGANTFADSEGSDYDAIATLLERLEKYPAARIYLFNDPNRTFHPKIYVFNNVGTALLIIGSSNWSDGGFVNNVEVNPIIRLNFDNKAESDLFGRIMSIFDTYWKERPAQNEGQGWARRVTKDNLSEFKHLLRVISQDPPSTPKIAERRATGDSPFAGIHFKTPRRFTSSRKKTLKAPKKSEPRPARIGTEVDQDGEEAGFWKILSKFDVSRGGAPGQIIIPIEFRSLFPNQTLVKAADAGGRGRQWDTEFPVNFRDGGFTDTALARFIVYEPETSHPRPNTECRFTFRNRAIFDRLNAGDILSFKFRQGSQPLFIERFSPTSEVYRALRTSRGRWGTV